MRYQDSVRGPQWYGGVHVVTQDPDDEEEGVLLCRLLLFLFTALLQTTIFFLFSLAIDQLVVACLMFTVIPEYNRGCA
jgi:hypothetical protein